MDNFDQSFAPFYHDGVIMEDLDINSLDEIHTFIAEEFEQQAADQSVTTTGNIPSRDDFPGSFDFKLTIDEAVSNQHWVYSPILHQLFTGMNKTLILPFKISPEIWSNPMTRFYIVALPVYSTDEYINVPVNRCTLHAVEDDPHGQAHQQEDDCQCGPSNKYVGHVLRVGTSDAEYLFDRRSKRHSVRVPVKPPQAGSDELLIPYSFSCKTSCQKGMQRRPIHVIFTLEDEHGSVYGRQKIGVKICSCPKRDRKRQEDDYTATQEPYQEGDGRRKRTTTCEAKPLVKRTLLEEKPLIIPDIFGSIPNIQVEDSNLRFTDRFEIAAELKRRLNILKRTISGITDAMVAVENEVNRISELQEKLL